MKTKFVFNALSGQFDLVTSELSPSEVVGGTVYTVAAYDSTGALGELSTLTYDPAWGNPNLYIDFNAALTGYTTLLNLNGQVSAPQTEGLAGLNYNLQVNDAAAGILGVAISGAMTGTGSASQSILGFQDAFRIDSGGIANSGYTSFQANPSFAAGSSHQGGYYGLSISPYFEGNWGSQGFQGIQISPSLNSAIQYVTGVQVGVQFNAGTAVANNSQMFAEASSYQSGSSVSNHNSYGAFPQFLTGSAVSNYVSYQASPLVNENVTSLTLGQWGGSGTGIITNTMGLDINLSGFTSTNRPVGLNVQTGVLNVNSQVRTQSSVGVDSINSLIPMLFIDSGSPITGTTVFGQNMANLLFADDDFAAGPLGTSLASVAFVGNNTIAAGKTVDTLSMAFSGCQMSGDGTTTNIVLYDALGVLTGTGTPIVTNAYGLRVGSLMSTVAANSWGINVQDTNSENFLKKSLAINTANEKVSASGIGLEILTKDILLDGGKLTLVGNSNQVSIQASASTTGAYTLTLPVDDGTAGQVLSTDGSGVLSWISAGGGGVTSVSASAPLASSGGATPNITISQATTSTDGYLSSTDWNTFNNKEPAITTLSIAKGGTNSSTALSNNRVMQSSGGAIVEAAAITAARALISDANGIPTHSATTSTELGYVSGVTSAIQTQINGKLTDPMTTNGDLITRAAGVASRVGIGTSGQVLTVSAGAPAWLTPASSGPLNVVSKTSAYTATVTDEVILCSGSAFTVTLYAASGNAGRQIRIIKTDSTAANVITVDGNGSETIQGSLTIKLCSQYEEISIMCDGSNWFILSTNLTVAASYRITADFAASTTVPINFDGVEYDTHSTVTTSATAWKFTAPYAGLYDISGFADNGSASAFLLVYKNGTSYKTVAWDNTTTAGAISGEIMLAAGDFIDFRPNVSATYNGGALNGGDTGVITIKLVGLKGG